MTQARTREHAGHSSAFALYLEEEAVNTRLKANLIRYCAPVNMEMYGIGTLSRCFNDMPRLYFGLQPLLDSVIDAVRNHEMDIWVYFALAIAMDDLLDEKGELRKEIHDAMNYRHMLDYVTESNNKDAIKVQILNSYILMLYEYVLKLTPLATHRNVANPDEDQTIKLSRAINQLLQSLDEQTFDHHFINFINATLIKAGNNPYLSSKSLQNHILNFNCRKMRQHALEDELGEQEKEISRLKDEIARLKTSHRGMEKQPVLTNYANLFSIHRYNHNL